MKKEFDFRDAKRATFRNLPPIEDLDRHTKVRITMMLDFDILKFFKARAAKPGSEPYQTQINRALREYIAAQTARDEKRLLDDDRFISQLAERVAEYSAGTARAGRRDSEARRARRRRS